ncbi:hypothetical protein [Pseudomonas marginalis]|uniref:hypothetical protein n=1 Tax=Pseudomonas marginalis TaxID=298 RepID=UPI0034D5AD80
MPEKKNDAFLLWQQFVEATKASKTAPGSSLTVPPPLPPIPQLVPASPTVKGLWYNQKVIKLDGWVFDSCRFDNCKLIIETPNFELKSCYLDDTNTIEVNGKLVNVVKFLNMRGDLSDHPNYLPVHNEDGTVTIGG